MARCAWTWNVKPECVEEYVKLHGAVWPEVCKAHTDAGIRNYSIFQNGCQFFYVYECADPAATAAAIGADEACQKWDAITSKMVEGSFDWGDSEPVRYMPEVFYLK